MQCNLCKCDFSVAILLFGPPYRFWFPFCLSCMFWLRLYEKSDCDCVDPIFQLHLKPSFLPLQLVMAQDIKSDSFMPKTTQFVSPVPYPWRSTMFHNRWHGSPLYVIHCCSFSALPSLFEWAMRTRLNNTYMEHFLLSREYALPSLSGRKWNLSFCAVTSSSLTLERWIAVWMLMRNHQTWTLLLKHRVLQEVRLKTCSARHCQCKDENLWLVTLVFH